MLALGLAACAGPGGGGLTAGDGPAPAVREVAVRVVRPPAVNLIDHGIGVLLVAPFQGPGGDEISQSLARQLGPSGPLRALTPEEAWDRLMKAGVAIGWDAQQASLRRLAEQGGVEGAVVGRVETFEVEGREKSEDTVTLKRTGQYGFVLNEEGKVAYREKLEYAQVPLYCRTDQGTVAASYRVWKAGQTDPVATRRYEITMEIPSFCYRGDVSDRLKREAQNRLLQKLFRELNARFLRDIVPTQEAASIPFEVLPAGGDAAQVYRNELALVYVARGEWGRAREMWRECLAERPQLAAAHYNLARLNQIEGRLTAAADHLGKALALSPNPLYRAALREVKGAPPP